MPDPTPLEAITHAGTVVFRDDGGERRYLVVRARRAARWVLPKGHVEPGEALDVTALRELREEAGVTGRVVAPLAIREMGTDHRRAVVAWFLVGREGEAPADEEREIRWCPVEEALELLSFEDAREVVREADACAASAARPPPRS